MRRNLELRSTYHYQDTGMGAIALDPQTVFNSTPLTVEEPTETEPSFKNEYAVATAMSKSICDSLSTDLKEIIEAYASKKLSSKINKALDLKEGAIGISKFPMVEGFEFNSSNTFGKGANINPCIRQGADKGHVIIHYPAFVPANCLNVPEEATNFKISARLVALSDFHEKNGGYDPVNVEENGCWAGYDSPMLPVLRIQTQPLTAQLSIDEYRSNMKASTVLIMAIKFYHYDHSKFEYLPEHSMMKVVKVY